MLKPSLYKGMFLLSEKVEPKERNWVFADFLIPKSLQHIAVELRKYLFVAKTQFLWTLDSIKETLKSRSPYYYCVSCSNYLNLTVVFFIHTLCARSTGKRWSLILKSLGKAFKRENKNVMVGNKFVNEGSLWCINTQR